MTQLLQKKYIKTLLALLFFLLIPLTIFWPVIFGGKAFASQVVSGTFYPFFSFYQDFLRDHGSMPLWMDGYLSGFPIWLSLSESVFPFTLVLLLIFNFVLAYNVLTVFSLGLAGFFTYFFARALLCSRPSSFLAGIVYVFANTGILWAIQPIFNIAAAVIPILFLSVLRIAQGKKHYICIGALSLGLGWLGGFTEIIFYGGIGAFFFALYLDILHWRLILPGRFFLRLLRRFRITLQYTAMALSGTLLVSPWMISVMNIIRLSERAGGARRQMISDPTGFQGIVHFLYPHFSLPTGIDFGGDYYIGLLPFVFVVFSFIFWRERRHVAFFGLVALATLFLNVYSEAYVQLSKLPIFNLFKAPFKLLYIGRFSFAVAAGLGLDYMLQTRQEGKTLLRRFLISAAVFLAATSLGMGIVGIFFDGFFTIHFTRFLIVAGLSAIVLLFLRYFKAREDGQYCAFHRLTFILVITAVSLDFFLTWRGFHQFTQASLYERTGAFKQWMQSKEIPENPPFRYKRFNPSIHQILPVSAISPVFDREALEPNMHVFDRIDGVEGWGEALMSRRQLNLWLLISHYPPLRFTSEGLLQRKDEIFSSRYWKDLTAGDSGLQALSQEQILQTYMPVFRASAMVIDYHDPATLNLLSMMNVRYISSSLSFSAPWKQIFSIVFPVETRSVDGKRTSNVPIFFYENPDVLPRVYFAHRVRRIAEDETQALKELKTIDNFSRETLLECANQECFAYPEQSEASGDAIEIQERYSGYLRVKTRTRTPRWLIYSESNLPTWEARIDGEPTNIHTANYLFQAIYVSAGEHEVEFRYPGVLKQLKYALKDLL